MATSKEIKEFIASWLQLGKAVDHQDGVTRFKPARILGYRGYSPEFEAWWQQEFEPDPEQWFLQGSSHPLSMLYTPSWEIMHCARCEMPIPIPTAGINDDTCPCSDLPSWPNLDLPHPHVPGDVEDKLHQIHLKLKK